MEWLAGRSEEVNNKSTFRHPQENCHKHAETRAESAAAEG
jgi:hypothetical protein